MKSKDLNLKRDRIKFLSFKNVITFTLIKLMLVTLFKELKTIAINNSKYYNL